MSYEDSCCDDEFNTESVPDFVRDNIGDEYDEYIMRKYMKPCINCGELVSKENIQSNGMCYLCSKSEDHQRIRGSSSNANGNFHSIKEMVSKWSIDE